MVRWATWTAAIALGGLWPGSSLADPWNDLAPHLAPGAQIVERTAARLVVRVGGQQLVVGTGPAPGVQFYFVERFRRGRNPYRVWYVDRKFHKQPHVPKRAWPRFFRMSFLRLLRVPRAKR